MCSFLPLPSAASEARRAPKARRFCGDERSKAAAQAEEQAHEAIERAKELARLAEESAQRVTQAKLRLTRATR